MQRIQIAPLQENEIENIVEVYQQAFATEPWYEYYKCQSCGQNFGKATEYETGDICPHCNDLLVLEEYWPKDIVASKVRYAQKQKDSIVLVAHKGDVTIGFVWGYRIVAKEVPELSIHVPEESFYIAEIAVRSDIFSQGVGSRLIRALLEEVAKDSEIPMITLRTDYRNPRSVGLFQKAGFLRLKDALGNDVVDKRFTNRGYFVKQNVMEDIKDEVVR